jgi:hypothetical protein
MVERKKTWYKLQTFGHLLSRSHKIHPVAPLGVSFVDGTSIKRLQGPSEKSVFAAILTVLAEKELIIDPLLCIGPPPSRAELAQKQAPATVVVGATCNIWPQL